MPRLPLFLGFLLLSGTPFHSDAQWLEWDIQTDERLVLTSVANADDEEKDIWPADLNKDGWTDIIVVRKEPFSAASEPPKSDLLLINQEGVLVDMTADLAPEFISNPSFARDIYVVDVDGDAWDDVVIVNTFNQQPMLYMNLGEDADGNWLGLTDDSDARFPTLVSDEPLICAVWAGDLTGNGAQDLYFVNYRVNSGGGTAKDFLLINDGTGHFTDEGASRAGNLLNSAFGTAGQIHDMDGDGDLDIVKNTTLYNVFPWNSRGVIVLFNDGTGNFPTWQNLVPSSSPYMFEVVDFNGDGLLDLYVVDDGADKILTATSHTPNVSLGFNTVNLNFSSSNGFGGNVHAADLDLDGDLDVVVSDVDVDIPPCNSSRRMAIYENDNGTFLDPYGNNNFDWVTNSYDVALLDINNDGLVDILSGKCAGYDVIMSNNCALAASSADFDLDGIPDACDVCPTNPSPDCEEETTFPVANTGHSMARQWNELLLESIRGDFARPTVHARNLWHSSMLMWDAWAVMDPTACPAFLGQDLGGYVADFDAFTPSTTVEAARDKAIAYGMYRLLRHRFANAPQASNLFLGYDAHMATLGYDADFTSTDYSTGDGRALGNHLAAEIIAFGLQDQSNEQNDFANLVYEPSNPSLIVDLPGNATVQDLNRWQPLTLDLFIDQSGNPIPGETPTFLSPEWGQVTSWALSDEDLTSYTRDGFEYKVYHDPGAPALHAMDGSGTSDIYSDGHAMVALWSGLLDPTDGVMWDISPASSGNRDSYPTTLETYASLYDADNGGSPGPGHSVNPATGQAYAPNMVPRGDFTRVLAEFWADGPDSETPPGHWFTILNYVSDHPDLVKQFQGQGDILSDLEWDVKAYLALGAAMQDCAIAAWGAKGWYDTSRPVTAIRGMAELGQRTDPTANNFHPGGLPLIPGKIETIQPGDPLAGAFGVNVGKIKLWAWLGSAAINNVDTDFAGVGWVLAESWEPYQRPSFVSPPFAGYVSGHSTFSRAAAEVLTAFTGDAYFPGGMGTFLAPANEFLVFEEGPSVDVELQWATYRDASDECSLSRIYGGIHPYFDDVPGRLMGIEIGLDAFDRAATFYGDGLTDITCDADPSTDTCPADLDNDGFIVIGDVLIFLGDFGCSESCTADINGDGSVNVQDLLEGILSNFGTPCP
ncbi:MAG: FG-GAP-like repeat-containing protein [Bacteroidota bacterium]|nr:FG-GAP-like repeat-containing protein [Bacteroidota bacterium]